MGYREVVPPSRWRAALECGWTSVRRPGDAAPAHGVLPDGCMDLVWDGAALVVAGPDTTAHPVERVDGVRSAGLRFAPGALPVLLGVPADALRDQRVPLADLRPGPARDAVARLGDGAAPLRVLLGVADALAAERGGLTDPLVTAAVERLGAGAGAAETADALGCTTRTLLRHSLASFGYGPAVLRRVLRFRRAVSLLQSGVPTADAAAQAGYADQPHLSREVRAMAGVSPAVLAGR